MIGEKSPSAFLRAFRHLASRFLIYALLSQHDSSIYNIQLVPTRFHPNVRLILGTSQIRPTYRSNPLESLCSRGGILPPVRTLPRHKVLPAEPRHLLSANSARRSRLVSCYGGDTIRAYSRSLRRPRLLPQKLRQFALSPENISTCFISVFQQIFKFHLQI